MVIFMFLMIFLQIADKSGYFEKYCLKSGEIWNKLSNLSNFHIFFDKISLNLPMQRLF